MKRKARGASKGVEYLLELVNGHSTGREVEKLRKIKSELDELNNMIGNEDVKTLISSRVLMLVQGLNGNEMTNTALMGPPGVGKSTLAYIIGNIFKKLGILKRAKFYSVGREDLIGQFLGETAIKTREVLESSLGGVLFIDEAYSLGNNEKRDSFSKECIDTLTKFLSEHPKDILVIIAGYENDLQESFFNQNPGLDRRFPWRFKMKHYKGNELKEIFKLQMRKEGWRIESDEKLLELFNKNESVFQNNGGDTENLFACIKVEHSVRVFNKPKKYKKFMNNEDIEKGFAVYLSNKPKEDNKAFLTTMYT
tara:strand:+ start:39 stop:965 length:927 start_codon:yes stop_codon:yes gene_type:complete